MTGVIIAAEQRARGLWAVLPELLKRHFSVFTMDNPPANQSASGLLICPPEALDSLKTDSAIIICKDKGYIPARLPSRLNAVAVVDSGAPEIMELVSATKLPAITCGLSPRDTITLTSFGEDSAVLGLQREVDHFGGGKAEPQEIPVRLGGIKDSYVLMALAAVFILTGNIARLKYTDFKLQG